MTMPRNELLLRCRQAPACSILAPVCKVLFFLVVLPMAITNMQVTQWKEENGIWIINAKKSEEVSKAVTYDIRSGVGVKRDILDEISGIYKVSRRGKSKEQTRLSQVWHSERAAAECDSDDEHSFLFGGLCSTKAPSSLNRMIRWLTAHRDGAFDKLEQMSKKPKKHEIPIFSFKKDNPSSSKASEQQCYWTITLINPSSPYVNETQIVEFYYRSPPLPRCTILRNGKDEIPSPSSGSYELISVNAKEDREPKVPLQVHNSALRVVNDQIATASPSSIYISVLPPKEEWWLFPSEKHTISANIPRRDKQQRGGGGILRQAWQHPTTTIFWLLNVGLFLHYWNTSVSPATVAINGSIYREFGRAFSGCLAHFDLWHIGFNMMSWWSLGLQLEPMFGSIPFFLYTASLIPLTTVTMLLLGGFSRYIRQNRSAFTSPRAVGVSCSSCIVGGNCGRAIIQSLPPPDELPNTVGFSGVLFAWMVVATLSSPHPSCPIFFLPDLCFETVQFVGMHFNVGPLVQLVMLQVILPRVSFFGHLAGIVLGFALHWGMLPLEWIQPVIIFPILWFSGKILLRVQTFAAENTAVQDPFLDTPSVSRGSPVVGTFTLKALLWLRTGQLMVMALQIFARGLSISSHILSHALILTCVYLTTKKQSGNHEGFNSWLSNVQLQTMVRGIIVLLCIVIFTDCAMYGVWIELSIIWNRTRLHLILDMIDTSLRMAVLFLVSQFLSQGEQQSSNTGDIFWTLFHWPIISPIDAIISHLGQPAPQSSAAKYDWNFSGQGFRLGGANEVVTAKHRKNSDENLALTKEGSASSPPPLESELI